MYVYVGACLSKYWQFNMNGPGGGGEGLARNKNGTPMRFGCRLIRAFTAVIVQARRSSG